MDPIFPMDRQLAEGLVNELRKHSGIVTPDRELFLNMLASTNVVESSRFCEVLPDTQQLVEEPDRYHYLSMRRLLRNENARDYQLSQWKRACEAIGSAFGVYSSDVLSRTLRADRGLIEMMATCGEPFSLLGKLQTYDSDNFDNILFVITRPILVVPGVRDMKRVYDWEEANATYETEIRLFGLLPIQKRIKPQDYFSH